MTLSQLHAVYRLKVKRDNLHLIALSTAYRAAKSDEDGFKQFIKTLEG
ncbi:hypothetical protein vBVhaSVHB1_17 [Vibrio phage vB_VhaS-VHB1]|nr:hypothetical protein vBVhaSVHB1_17 [Vibrio phage vB_VhaS-VHB1]